MITIYLKKLSIVLLGILLINFDLYAQYIATPPILNGSISANEYGNVAEGSNQLTVGGVTTYMTWDASKLYIAVSGASVSDATIIYIDKDNLVPVNSGTSANGVAIGQLYDGTNFANLPFKADLVIYAKNGSYSYRTNVSGAWSAASSSNMAYSDNSLSSSSGIKEFCIAWSVIGGIPASFNFFSYNTTLSGNVYNQAPAANASGAIGLSAMYERYFTITSTANGSATLPFSRDCYVFNNITSENNVAAISVYDYTMNTAGFSVTRSNTGGDWNISGTMVIGSGSIDFGSLVSLGYGNTSINNINILGGSLNFDQNTNSVFLSGNFTKTGGTFSCSGRQINFNGSNSQTWSSNTSENIDYFTISNTSSNGVSSTSNLTIGTANKNSFILNSNSNFTISNNAIVTINNNAIGTVDGNIKNSGATITIPSGAGVAASVTITSNGSYTHNMDGGAIPGFIWGASSLCQVTGWLSTSTLLQGLNQSFYNFTWNSASQTANLNFAGNLQTIKGDFKINSTGTGSIILTNTTPFTLNVSGNFNQSNGKLILSNNTGVPTINIGTTTSPGSFTQSGGSIDFNPVSDASLSVLTITGDFTRSGGSITHGGAGSNGVIQLGGSAMQKISSGNTISYVDIIVPANAITALTSDFQFTNGTFKLQTNGSLSCATFKLYGASSTFTQSASSTLKTGSLDAGGALTASSSSGSIQTTNRNYDKAGTFEYNGTGPQIFGDFTNSFPAGSTNTIATLTINNTTLITSSALTLSTPLTITSQLNFSKGKLTTGTNQLTISKTAIILGGGPNSFLDGPITKLFQNGLNGMFSFYFPTGNGSTYLPFSFDKPFTGSIAPSVTIKAYASGSGGSIDGSLSALSNTEYWQVTLNSGNFTKSNIVLGKNSVGSTFNTIAKSSTANGTYSFIGGTSISSTSITSTATPTGIGYFTFATSMADPTITAIKPSALPSITTPDGSGYYGQTIKITGTNFLSTGLTVTINSLVVSYTFIDNTDITVVVPQGAVTDNLVVKNTGTGGSATQAFTVNGYITTQAGDWNSTTTWLGGVIPPQYSTVTIKDAITALSDPSNFPNNLLIVQSAGSLTMGSMSTGANLIVYNQFTNNGVFNMGNNCSISIGNSGVFDNGSTISPPFATFTSTGNSFIYFPGDGTTAGTGTLKGTIIANNIITACQLSFGNSVTINGYLEINPNGIILNNAPYYSNNSKLIYNTGNSTYHPGLEWSAASPGAGYPNNIDIGQNLSTNLDLSLIQNPSVPGAFIPASAPFALAGVLHITYNGIINLNNSNQSLKVLGDLIMDASSQLLLSTTVGGDLILGSDWDNRGSFTANNGTVLFKNQSKNQYFYPTAPTTFNILTIDKGAYNFTFASTVNLEVKIANQINIKSGNVDFNNRHITFLSTANQTASISQILGTLNPATANNITVERYYPPHRCWRMVSVPLSSTYTINHEWQEGQVNTSSTNSDAIPNYGTHISGPQPGLGFDVTPRNNSSMKQYDKINDAWVAVPNTNVMNLASQSAYMLFVRGSRSINLYGSATGASTPTTLRTNGSLRIGDQTYSVNTPVNRYTLIGNPYPSSIDFHKIIKSGGLGDKFIVWDPQLNGNYGVGGFVTFTWNSGSGSYVSSLPPASAGLGQYIQSGQAFLVQGSGAAESVIINEACKVSNNTSNVFKALGNSTPQISIGLNAMNADGTQTVTDGTLAIYGDDFSNALDKTDAAKINNFRENVFLVRDNNSLAIEARKTITSPTDTLFLNVNTYIKDYSFTIVPSAFDKDISAFLLDKYMQIELPLKMDDTTFYKFQVTNDLGTQAEDRFKIVLKKLTTLPVTFTSVTASKIEEHSSLISWKVQSQINIRQYEIQRSIDGISFHTIGKVASAAASTLSYSFTDNEPNTGENFYRVISIGNNGEKIYSSIVKLSFNSVVQDIKIFPNPISNGVVNIYFNKFEKGNYNLNIYNATGQEVYEKSLSKETSASGQISIPINLKPGKYVVSIIQPNGHITTLHFIR